MTSAGQEPSGRTEDVLGIIWWQDYHHTFLKKWGQLEISDLWWPWGGKELSVWFSDKSRYLEIVHIGLIIPLNRYWFTFFKIKQGVSCSISKYKEILVISVGWHYEVKLFQFFSSHITLYYIHSPFTQM